MTIDQHVARGNFWLSTIDAASTPFGSIVAQLAVVEVSANGDDGLGNVAGNVLDSDDATRWSYDADPSELTLDLGAVVDLGAVDIAWYLGDERTSIFEIAVSDDGAAWTVVHLATSSGLTAGFERYDFVDTSGRFVKILGYGNDGSVGSSPWTSITGVKVFGHTGTGGAGGTAPTAPFLEVVPGDGENVISWPAVFSADSYSLEASIAGAGFAVIDGSAVSPVTHGPLTNDVRVEYRATATNTHGTSGYSEVVAGTPTSAGGGEPEEPVPTPTGWQDAHDLSVANERLDEILAWFEANTGHTTAEGSLTDVGHLTTTQADEHFSGFRCTGIQVNHPGCTFDDFLVEGEGQYGIRLDSGVAATFEHFTIRGISGTRLSGIVHYGAVTARYGRISGYQDGIKFGSSELIEYCWIEDDYYRPSGSHNDGMQQTSGSNVTVRRNLIQGRLNSQTAAIIIGAVGSIGDVTIQENFLYGGNFCLYIEDKGAGDPSGMTVVDNVFVGATTGPGPGDSRNLDHPDYDVRNTWQYGPTQLNVGSGWTWSGNRLLFTGDTVGI